MSNKKKTTTAANLNCRRFHDEPRTQKQRPVPLREHRRRRQFTRALPQHLPHTRDGALKEVLRASATSAKSMAVSASGHTILPAVRSSAAVLVILAARRVTTVRRITGNGRNAIFPCEPPSQRLAWGRGNSKAHDVEKCCSMRDGLPLAHRLLSVELSHRDPYHGRKLKNQNSCRSLAP